MTKQMQVVFSSVKKKLKFPNQQKLKLVQMLKLQWKLDHLEVAFSLNEYFKVEIINLFYPHHQKSGKSKKLEQRWFLNIPLKSGKFREIKKIVVILWEKSGNFIDINSDIYQYIIYCSLCCSCSWVLLFIYLDGLSR